MLLVRVNWRVIVVNWGELVGSGISDHVVGEVGHCWPIVLLLLLLLLRNLLWLLVAEVVADELGLLLRLLVHFDGRVEG